MDEITEELTNNNTTVATTTKKSNFPTIKTGGGTGFFGMLFITFLVLKLTNVINWSWWWITAPLWGPIALVVGGVVVIGVLAFICVFISDLFKNKGR